MAKQDNIIMIKADGFSNRIVKMCQILTAQRHELVLSKQILRSGTSVGANVAEAEYAQSPADFVSKMSIALKEANETLYWIDKLFAGSYLTKQEYQSIKADNEELLKIMTSIIKTKKRNLGLL